MSKEERKYCVYCHTNKVNGKKYVGITSQRPKARWGKNGKGYTHCTYFYNAIKKHGWDSFIHEILFEGLSKEEAEDKEIELIAEWNLNNENFGYNIAKGGATYSEEARAKLSKALKGKRLGVQPSNYKPLAGERFGRLIVVSDFTKSWRHYCICKCDCGNEVTVMADNLKNHKHTQSCGCYKFKRITEANGTHGMTRTRLYIIWQYIKTRCYKKGAKNYLEGIEVCDDWKDDFMSFYAWAMSNGYKEELSLLRKDNNKDYDPSNCYWGNNKYARGKRVLCVETGIEYKSAKEASKLTGISRNAIEKNLEGYRKTAGSRGSNSNNGKGFHFVYITNESLKEDKK